MCWMVVLSYNHGLHGICGDGADSNSTGDIAGELLSSRVAHICKPTHAHLSPLAHAHPATLVEAMRVRFTAGCRRALPQA